MNKIKEIFLYANWKNILFSLLGSLILAFGTHYIYVNSHIPEAGMIGMCLIIESLTGISVPVSIVVITVLCYILAWRLMGTRYILNTSVATIGFAVFYAIFSSDALTNLIPAIEYPLLAALIGALLVGTALTHRFGSAPSGEQALTMAIAKRGSFDFAWVQFIRDFLILSLSLLTYEDPADGIYNVIFAILIMTLLTPVTDFIVSAPKKVKMTKRIQKTKKSWIPIIGIGLVLALIMTATTIYLTDVYPANIVEINRYVSENVGDTYTITIDDDADMIIYTPKGKIKEGFIFYPGGKVDPESYTPLMAECASQGILCVTVEMPFNLAVFGINKAMDVIAAFPEIDSWYIGGHSLGGSMAATCATTYPEHFKGLIFLASYSTADVSSFRTLSVYGSNDEVMEEKNYIKYKENFPDKFSDNLVEVELRGGNHSYFGIYGDQRGDGKADITNEEQIKQSAQLIISFILSE